MSKLDTLQSALNGREEEILNYRINIDNYTRAIVKIEAEHADKPGMSEFAANLSSCLLYTSPSPRDGLLSRMPSSA